MRALIQRLRRVMLLQDGAGMTDGQLLECFIQRRDDAAFEALMRFHGPMVLGVCQRVLANHHDAEDAVQATFLVLSSKAASIFPRERVGNWLYGVAYRTALKAKGMRAKRRTRETQVPNLPEVEAEQEKLWSEIAPLLDQELIRLNEKYRATVILCDLEGKTHKEAARQLQTTERAVAMRLVRARNMLAKRLSRHGVVFSTGSLVLLLSQSAASASVPATVIESTVQSIRISGIGQAASAGIISSDVTALTEGVLKTMFLATIRSVALAIALVVALGVGAGQLLRGTHAAEPAKAQQANTGTNPAAPPKQNINPNAEKITALLQERRDALAQLAEISRKLHRNGRAPLELAIQAQVDWQNAALELTTEPELRLAIRRQIIDILKELEGIAQQHKAAAQGTEADVLRAKAARLQAEADLLREEAPAR